MSIPVLTYEVMTVRYAELASSTIVLYDHIVTLDLEIELIWRSGWSVGKILFLLNRYYTLFVVIFNNYVMFSPHLSNKVSDQFFRWQGSTGIVAFAFGELILQLRLYALYYLDKRVLILMSITFVSALAASSTVLAISLSKIIAISNLIPGLPFCVPLRLPKTFYAFWIPILISETMMCGLALMRGVQSCFRRKRSYHSGRRLLEILLRDSFLYFLILFAVYLSNTVIFILGNPAQLESAIGYSVAMSCVMGNRLCLNVRGMLTSTEDMLNDVRPPPHFSNGIREGGTISFVLRGSGGETLTEMELHELRHMRAARARV